MSFAFGHLSNARLIGVHPKLVEVLERAIEISEQDFMILEGVRSREQMAINYGKGRTAAECEAKGVAARYAQPHAAKVTWLNDPFKSNHAVKSDGYGYAVDAVPYPVDFNTISKYDAIAKAVLRAAKEKGVKIRWGDDWNQNGIPRERGETDAGHFEMV